MIVRKTFTVEVDGATFHFTKPTRGDFESIKEKDSKLDIIWDRLLKIEGLKDENGEVIEFSKETIIDLPIDAVTAIVNAWRDEFKRMTGVDLTGGDPAKNVPKPT